METAACFLLFVRTRREMAPWSVDRKEKTLLHVAVIGEYDQRKSTHPATSSALMRAGEALGEFTQVTWIETSALAQNVALLQAYDAIVASPGSPYTDFHGALRGIRYAREHGRPFLGT